jgi:phenylalanyl-tRNA synthetase beta chain
LLSSALLIATKSGKQLGSLGIVRSDIAKRCGVKAQVLFCELDWNELTKLAIKRKVTYAPLPKTQAVKRDLSLLIDSTVTMADIEKVVRDSERKLLRSVTLFDVYEGDKLPAGKKSYAISMTLRDDEKTLQDKYIDQIMSRIIANLTSKLGAELR